MALNPVLAESKNSNQPVRCTQNTKKCIQIPFTLTTETQNSVLIDLDNGDIVRIDLSEYIQGNSPVDVPDTLKLDIRLNGKWKEYTMYYGGRVVNPETQNTLSIQKKYLLKLVKTYSQKLDSTYLDIHGRIVGDEYGFEFELIELP